MKCPYCGGEVSSQAGSCPFCGRENPEGIAFLQEINQKVERNRLLRPFLIRQKTPELKQKMLTRILFIIIGCNVLLVVFSFCLFLWSERDVKRELIQGSQAWLYEEEHYEGGYEYDYFMEYVEDYLEAIEDEEQPENELLEELVDYGYRAMAVLQPKDEDDEKTKAQKEERRLFIHAFFEGCLGLSEEEASFLEADSVSDYSWRLDEEKQQQVVQLILHKLEEVKP